jgi:hypothetical protein
MSGTMTSAYATNWDLNKAFDFWATDGWNEFGYVDGIAGSGNNLLNGSPDGVIDPGSGGQKFDTEYLFYKYDSTTNQMSIGLQTGFDVIDGKTEYGGGDYYAGDLALSFATGHVNDGVTISDTSENSSTYEYAVDFGLWTKKWLRSRGQFNGHWWYPV